MSYSTTELARRALNGLPATDVLRIVDQLDLRPSPQTPAVLLVPLRSLKQRRDVATFVRTAPVRTASFLLEVAGHEVLDTLIEKLGDAAEQPTFDQLASAVDDVLAQGADPALVRATLAHVAVEGFPARDHCLKLIEQRDVLSLPAID